MTSARTLPAKDPALKAAKYKGKGIETEYRIQDVPGLVLTVQRPRRDGASNKVWRCYYNRVEDGKRTIRKQRIGKYPAVTLRKARQEADRIRDQVDLGVDVVAEERKVRQIERRASLNFENLVDDYLAERRQINAIKTLSEIERCLRRDAVPVLGHLQPSEITDLEIETCVDGVADRGSRVMALHLLTYLRTVFNYAIRSPKLRGKYALSHNPAEHVGRGLGRGSPGKYGKVQARDRALDDNEIALFLAAHEASQTDDATQAIIKVLLYTGQRASEVREMAISELRIKDKNPMWELPKERSKNKVPNIIPLAPPVLKIIEHAIGGRRRGPVFLSRNSEFVGEYTIRQAIQRLFDKGRLDIPRFTPHDLRRTVETGLTRLRVPKEVRDKVLNHKDASVGGLHYKKHEYLDEKREALENWAEHIARLMI